MVKRSGFKRKPGGKGLARKPLERKPDAKPLARGDGPKPNPDRVRAWIGKSRAQVRANRRKATPREARDHAYIRDKGRCVVCGRKDVPGWPLQPHHVFPVASSIESFPELEGEGANLVMVCPGCHDAHERAMPRIPRAKLPAETVALADGDDKRMAYLVRTYP